MIELPSDWLFTALLAFGVSLMTLAGQHLLQLVRQRMKKRELEAQAKLQVVHEIVSRLFVLTRRQTSPEDVARANAALCSVPLYFADNEECMKAYRAMKEDFNQDNFYKFVIELMKEVPMETRNIKKDLITNAPIVAGANLHFH